MSPKVVSQVKVYLIVGCPRRAISMTTSPSYELAVLAPEEIRPIKMPEFAVATALGSECAAYGHEELFLA